MQMSKEKKRLKMLKEESFDAEKRELFFFAIGKMLSGRRVQSRNVCYRAQPPVSSAGVRRSTFHWHLEAGDVGPTNGISIIFKDEGILLANGPRPKSWTV